MSRFFDTMARKARRATILCCLMLGAPYACAASTSLELYGLLFDGVGNRITASPYIVTSTALYSSATGGELLADFGTENLQVNDGRFLQIFGLDDSVFSGDAYLQLTLNGFTMAPRLGVFHNGSYYVADGITAGGPSGGDPVFRLYAGMAANVPEPEGYALLMAGLATLGFVRRRQGPPASKAMAPGSRAADGSR